VNPSLSVKYLVAIANGILPNSFHGFASAP
jgi:hypothetical protein